MTTHELKTHPRYFEAAANGKKTFEVRFDDRVFRTGDVLRLREFDEVYTGKTIDVKVTYLTTFAPIRDYVFMSIEVIPPYSHAAAQQAINQMENDRVARADHNEAMSDLTGVRR